MGSSGGRYSGPISESFRERLEKTQRMEQKRLEGNVNSMLQGLLARFNDRDTEATSERLDQIRKLLGTSAEIESVLLGGSVAKHTDVDGISDVDALVILNRSDLAGKPPQAVLDAFRNTLNESLPRSEVKSIEKGRLAITVTYKDEKEIQILPALRSGSTVNIPSADGRDWIATNPRAFNRELSKQNDRLNQGLVPAIKLMKALVSSFPEQKQLSGYHIEALALDAISGYRGPTTPKALLIHLLDHASNRVLEPISDLTGQSRTVDAYLGRASSIERRNVSQALGGMKRRLEAATTVGEWKTVFED